MSRARDLADLGGSADAGGLTGRNLIINGAMQVAQRGTSFTGFAAAVNYGIDRFANFHSSDGAFTISLETSVVPDDFTHALKIQTTTADASIAAGQRLIVFTRCEGNVVSQLNWGTSAAKTVTLSFYVRSSITGTHGGAFGNGSDDRNYPFTYTINSADTWERKTITVAGDTSGTWATGTGRSLQVVWGLGVGSTYSGTAGAWASGDINSATGATTGVLGTLNATWYLTGVQLEVGETATPFEHESFDTTYSKCLRYYETSYATGTAPGTSGGFTSMPSRAANSVNDTTQEWTFKVRKRGTMTVTIYGQGGTSGQAYVQSLSADVAAAVENGANGDHFRIYRSGGSDWTADTFVSANWECSSEL